MLFKEKAIPLNVTAGKLIKDYPTVFKGVDNNRLGQVLRRHRDKVKAKKVSGSELLGGKSKLVDCCHLVFVMAILINLYSC